MASATAAAALADAAARSPAPQRSDGYAAGATPCIDALGTPLAPSRRSHRLASPSAGPRDLSLPGSCTESRPVPFCGRHDETQPRRRPWASLLHVGAATTAEETSRAPCDRAPALPLCPLASTGTCPVPGNVPCRSHAAGPRAQRCAPNPPPRLAVVRRCGRICGIAFTDSVLDVGVLRLRPNRLGFLHLRPSRRPWCSGSRRIWAAPQRARHAECRPCRRRSRLATGWEPPADSACGGCPPDASPGAPPQLGPRTCRPSARPGAPQRFPQRKTARARCSGRWGVRFRRRPTFPRGCPRSIIGAGGLDDRVRDGIG